MISVIDDTQVIEPGSLPFEDVLKRCHHQKESSERMRGVGEQIRVLPN